MTQFYLPFTKIHGDVWNALPEGTITVDVSGSPDAYWAALCEWWVKGEDFAVIEHDVICRPDVIEQFDSCPEPWCVFGYDPICHEACQEAWANMLGCTRFRAVITAEFPDAVTSIPPQDRNWNNLCDHLAGNKLHGVPCDQRPGGIREQFTHHWHRPSVRHRSWETWHVEEFA